MRVLDKPSALRLITLFSGAVKGMAFYPASHPAIRQPLMELYKILTTALTEGEQISWGLLDGIMFLDDHLFISPSAAVADLTNRMLEKEISRVVVTSSVSFDELASFIKLISAKGVSCDTLSRQMKEQGITAFKLVCHGDEHIIQADDDLERGRIPGSAPLIKVVDQMVGITMREPSAMLGLTMIKDYDNYTYNHCVT